MFNGIYKLFAGSSLGDVFVESTPVNPPVLLVAAFTEAVEPEPFASHTNADMQPFMDDLMHWFPSSNFVLATCGDETAPSTATTPAVAETPRQLPAVFCHVILSRFQRHEVCVSSTSTFDSSLARELQMMPQSLHSPQELVAHMILHMGFRIILGDFCRLIAECRWLGNANLVAALLQCLAARTEVQDGLLAVKPKPRLMCTLQVRSTTHLDDADAADADVAGASGVAPAISLLEVGLRVESVASCAALRTESDHSMLSSRPPSCDTGMLQLKPSQQEEPPLFILILHVCNKGYTRQSLEELDWLLMQLAPNDTVFVSLAGDIVVYPCLAPEARQRWREGRDAARNKHKKYPLLLRVSIQRMWEQAKCVLAFWRHQRLRRVARGESAADSRFAILFFAPSDSCVVDEMSISCVQCQPAFFHVPVFSLVTPREVKAAYKLVKLCVLTQGRLLYTIGDDVDFTSGTPSRTACDALFRTTLRIIRSISHLDVAVLVVADHDSGKSFGPLNTSETFGKVSTALLRSDSPTKGSMGIYLELGPLSIGTEVPVYLSRHITGRLDSANIGMRMLVFAYAIDKGEYEVVPVTSLSAFTEAAAPPLPERAWWTSLHFAQKLVEDLQSKTVTEPDSMPNLPPEKAVLSGGICQQHAAQCPRNVFLQQLRRSDRRELLLVGWMLSRYSAREVGSLEDFETNTLTTLYQCRSAHLHLKEKKKSCTTVAQWVSPSTGSSVRSFVDLRWTIFSFHDAPVSSVEAILSCTFPFTSQPLRSTSKTLSLETLRCTSAVIHLASVRHVPVLTEAKVRLIALFSVDLSTDTMTLLRTVPATTPEGIVSNIVHEFKNLQLKQMYCVVHLALRQSPNLWIVPDDILVADGISFSTPWESVESVTINSVGHDTVELEWKGTSTHVEVVYSPLEPCCIRGKKLSRTKHNKHRNKTRIVVAPHLPLIATATTADTSSGISSGSPIVSGHEIASKCAITDLQPCTIYHVLVTPLGGGLDGMRVMEKKLVEGAELYFATCINPEECSILRVDSVVPRTVDFAVTLSCLEFSSIAAVSSTRWMKLRGTPCLTIDGITPDRGIVRMQRDNVSGERRVVSTFILPSSCRISVRIVFDVEVRSSAASMGGVSGGSSSSSSSSQNSSVGSKTNNNSSNSNVAWNGEGNRRRCGDYMWTKHAVMPHTEEVGPFEVVSHLSYALVKPTTVRLTWKGVSSTYTVSLMTYSDTEGGSVCARELLVSGSDPLELTLGDLVSCTRYEAIVKSTNGVSVSNVEFCIPPQPPSPNAVTIQSNMMFLLLKVQLPVNKCKERFISVSMMPLRAKMDNANNAGTRVVASYSHVPEGQPLIVGVAEHWVVSKDQCVSSATTHLYAVTDLRCRKEAEGIVVLEWTCAAGVHGAPLVVHVNGESHTIGTQNKLRIALGGFLTPIQVQFSGPTIIEEVSPIFLLPAPPALTALTCSVVAITSGVVQIHVKREFCALLSSLLSHLRESVRVLLCTSLGVEVEVVPHVGKKGLLLEIPVKDAKIRVITLRIKLQEKDEDVGMDDEMEGGTAVQTQPALLIPWNISEPFDIPLVSTKYIEGLHVTMLQPTSVVLSWSPCDVVSNDSEYSVQVVVRCGAEEFFISECRENVVCSNHSVLVQGLLPATPYVVTVCGCDGDAGESVRFVTPHELKLAVIQNLLASLRVLHLHENATRKLLPDKSGEGEESHSALLHLCIPPEEKVFWTVVPHSAWFGGVACDRNVPCLCVGASLRVALVAESGKLLQLWCSNESHSLPQNVTCTIFTGARNMAPLWPHLEVTVMSEVLHMAQIPHPPLPPPSTPPNREQRRWRHQVLVEEENAEDETLPSVPPMGTATQTMMMMMIPNNTVRERGLVVDLVGCPRLVFMDDSHCVIRWNGSCGSYNISWRVGPTGEIRQEVISQQPGCHPQFTLDITALDTLVVLFCVYGADCVSNCITFALLIPPRIMRVSACRSDQDGALLLRPVLKSSSSTELVKIEYCVEGAMMDVATDAGVLLCTASVADISSGVWTRGFSGMLEGKNRWYPLLPPAIEWLNPAMDIRCSLSSLQGPMKGA